MNKTLQNKNVYIIKYLTQMLCLTYLEIKCFMLKWRLNEFQPILFAEVFDSLWRKKGSVRIL